MKIPGTSARRQRERAPLYGGSGDDPFRALCRQERGGLLRGFDYRRQEGWSTQDIFDFCERVDPKTYNKRTLESLIKCGAFDGVGPRGPPWSRSTPRLWNGPPGA